MSDQYIPDLTERYPEPDDSASGVIEVGQVWEREVPPYGFNNLECTRIKEVHDNYIITEDGEQIDLDDLKNKWVLIG